MDVIYGGTETTSKNYHDLSLRFSRQQDPEAFHPVYAAVLFTSLGAQVQQYPGNARVVKHREAGIQSRP